VGKSTVAVNLAYQLAHMGGRIGLLDLDVYGPSLPVLVQQPEDVSVRRSPLGPGMVYPILHEQVKLLSLGFVSSNVSIQIFVLSPCLTSCVFLFVC
jgi:ATP-binding protein involved in chromosome partitioning